MDPRRSIVPIVEIDEINDNDIVGLAGTGFFVGPVPTLVTAAHVFRTDLTEGHGYAVAYVGKDGARMARIIPSEIVRSKQFDIAAVRRASLPGIEPLKLTPLIVPLNADVMTYEYSTTRIVRDSAGKRHVYFHPLTHKGNLMRASEHDDDWLPEIPKWETSFPALQGASGAPVIAHEGSGVVGMLVSNLERHLLPAQVVRIEAPDGVTEETKYFLPTGIAIRAIAIGIFLQELGIDADTFLRKSWQADWYGNSK